jgi:hypothetical protein
VRRERESERERHGANGGARVDPSLGKRRKKVPQSWKTEPSGDPKEDTESW